MPKRDRNRTCVVGLEREAVLNRLRPKALVASGPAKNLFALDRPLAPDALLLDVGENKVDVAWANPSRPGLVDVRIRALESGATEVEVRPDRIPIAAWERGARIAAWLMVGLPFIVHVYGMPLLFLGGLVLFAILSDRKHRRREYAKLCDVVAQEVHGRIQPFVLQFSSLAPYRRTTSMSTRGPQGDKAK